MADQGENGGYGKDQQTASHQDDAQGSTGHDERQSRGERFDEEQGGGRASDSISSDEVAQAGGSDGSFDQHIDDNPLTAAADELLRDRQAHQDRGQSAAEFESDAQS